MNSSLQLKKFFKRYMKVKDDKKDHAILSASGSERWLGCPATIKLSRGKKNVSHPSAEVGTNAHTLLQFILENPFNWGKLLRKPEATAFKNFISFSAEQLNSVLIAVHYVNSQHTLMKKRTGVTPKIYIEEKVELQGVGFGTPDVVLHQPFGLLHVTDYKNGKYKVEPEENSQGLYYAVAVADKVGWDFSKVRITIVQPNAPHRMGVIRTWDTTPERLEKAKIMFHRGAKRTKMKNPPIVPNNKYCWFCAARLTCPAQREIKAQKIISRFSKGADGEKEWD